VDEQARYEKYAELQEYVVDLCPSLFLYDQVQKQAVQSYVDWPPARGEIIPVMGYVMFGPTIAVTEP
jgi:peptide/nickel transport system substrate-binding protein